MTVIGEAFVVIKSIVQPGFADGASRQVAGSGFADKLESQFARAGQRSGAAFAAKVGTPDVASKFSSSGALAGSTFYNSATRDIAPKLERHLGGAGSRAGHALGANVGTGLKSSGFPGNITSLFSNGGLLAGTRFGATFATGLKTATGVAVAAVAAFGLKAAAEFQQTRIAFEGILGSAQKAQTFLSKMRAFAAKTPFEFPELATAAKSLLAVGFNANDVIPIMTKLGNVAASLGVGGEAINGVVRALGQMKGKGKASAEELNQISEQIPGFSAIKAIAEELGITTAQAFKRMESGAVSADVAVDAILAGMEKFPGAAGAMERQSKTLSGVISTLKDTFRDALINAIEPFLPAIAEGLAGLPDLAQRAFGPLAAATVHLIESLAPLSVAFAPIQAALQLVLPALGAFATGIDTIATVLEVLDNPIALVVVGIGAIAVAAAISAAGMHALALATLEATAALLTNPFVLAAAAIVALGVAVQTFRSRADPAIAVAKNMADSMFSVDSASTIFATGVSTATAALDRFFTTQARSKDSNFVKAILVGTGSTVDQLTAAVTGSATAWDQYAEASFDALKAAGASSIELVALNEQLQAQRDGFALTATVQATAAISTGALTRAQKNQIVEQNRFADGSVNLVAVLDEVNRRLAAQVEAQNKVVLATSSSKTALRDLAEQMSTGEVTAEGAAAAIAEMGLQGDGAKKLLDQLTATAAVLTAEQDHLALGTISTSKAYGTLATAIATGAISQVDATTALQEMGLSAEGADTAFKDLQDQIQTFVDGALSALPTVADAVSKFQSAISGDKSTLESDLKKRADLQKQLAEAGGKASDALRASIVENNAAIRADFQKLAEDSSPKKFTAELLENAKQITLFNHNILLLVNQGAGALAGRLAQLGPEQAGALAATLASDPSQAKVANAAAELGDAATGSYKKTLEENIGPLALTGEAAGQAIGTGISKGIIAELVRQIPGLKEFGIGAATEVDKGAKEGSAGKTTITDEMKASLGRHIPEFRGLGVPVGTNTMEGAKEGVGRANLGPAIETAIRRGGGKLRGTGRDIGESVDAGIASGIRENMHLITDALVGLTQHGIAVVVGQWRVGSPSRVFAEIGSQVGAGLAVGITGSASGVAAATALLASDVTTSVDDAVAALAFDATIDPHITPTIEPTVVFPDLPPVDLFGQLTVDAPVLDPVVLAATFAPIDPPPLPTLNLTPTVDPVVIAASFGPIAPPPLLDPVVLAASFGPVSPPAVDPVDLIGRLAPLVVPVPPPIELVATIPPLPPVPLVGQFAPLPAPPIDPVVLSATLGPLALPTLPALDLTVAPIDTPTVDPVVLTAAFGPIAPPTFPTLDLLGRLAPIEAPTVPPVELTIGPVPPLAPLTVSAEFAPIAPPDLAPIVLAASLAPLTVPPLAVPQLVAQLTIPPLDPVVVPASLAPLEVPPLTVPPVDVVAHVAPIAPVTIDAALAPLTVPQLTIPPVDVPLTIPPVDPIVVAASLTPFAIPPVDPVVVTPQLAPLVVPPIDPVVIGAQFGTVEPPVLPAVRPLIVPAAFADPPPPLLPDLAPASIPTAFTPPERPPTVPLIDPVSISTQFADPATFAPPPVPAVVIPSTIAEPPAPVVDPVVIAASFGPLALPKIEPPVITPKFAPDAGRLISSAVSSSVTAGLSSVLIGGGGGSAIVPALDFSKFDTTLHEAGETAGQRFTEWIDRLNELVPQGSGQSINEWSRSIQDFFGQDSGESISEWHRRLRDLVGGIHKSTGEVGADAEQLRRFLLALGGTKLAPIQPPSALSIREAATSLPVARPEDRANAQTPTRPGLFAGAVLNFPTNADPLHIAAEIAWTADLQTSIGG